VDYFTSSSIVARNYQLMELIELCPEGTYLKGIALYRVPLGDVSIVVSDACILID
jgi:hypothetical protein